MKKAYLMIYNDELGTRDQVKEVLDFHPVVTWRYDTPNSFYLISEGSAREVSDYIRSKLPQGRFVVTEIAGNYWGYSTADTWYLIKNKDHNIAK